MKKKSIVSRRRKQRSPFKDIFSLLPFPFSFSAYGAPSIYSALAPSMASILLRETPPSSAPLISSATTSRLCNPTAPTSSFVIEDQPYGLGGGGFRLPVNVGDYFEQLIQQLAENDPNRYETPPASKSAIDALVSQPSKSPIKTVKAKLEGRKIQFTGKHQRKVKGKKKDL
ncbi:hypothetical protein LINGRAPRIM_LOCUS2015 [Linum grandiflorum]